MTEADYGAACSIESSTICSNNLPLHLSATINRRLGVVVHPVPKYTSHPLSSRICICISISFSLFLSPWSSSSSTGAWSAIVTSTCEYLEPYNRTAVMASHRSGMQHTRLFNTSYKLQPCQPHPQSSSSVFPGTTPCRLLDLRSYRRARRSRN